MDPNVLWTAHNFPNDTNRTDKTEQVLGFDALTPNNRITVTSTNEELTINTTAQLSGLFFVVGDPHRDKQLRSLNTDIELTCYRRNMFGVRGLVSIHRLTQAKHSADSLSIRKLSRVYAKLSAVETLHNKPVTILWCPKVQEQATEEPRQLVFDLENKLSANIDLVSFHVGWERLKFRTSTSKNPRQQTTLQHYRLLIELITVDDRNEAVVLHRSVSAPIVVRGRSPGNFANPGGGTTVTRPASGEFLQQPTALDFTTWLDLPGVDFESPSNRAFATDEPLPSMALGPVVDPADSWVTFLDQYQTADVIPGLNDSGSMSARVVGKSATNISAGVIGDSHFSWLAAPPAISSSVEKRSTYKEDDSDERPTKISTGDSTEPSQIAANDESYPESSYQYFPLSVDDWTIPAQAVYRPHGVHNYGPPRARIGKRYFLEHTSDL